MYKKEKPKNANTISVFDHAKLSKKGFTLAELLMATLVISIIMVALAPVITRRAHDNVAITVNQKQGLEIFATPGIYSFDVPVGIDTLFLQGSGGGGGGGGATYVDKTTKYDTVGTHEWTVPTGVNYVSFKITGAGGGGGAANAQVNTTDITATTSTLKPDSCLSDEFLAIRGANTEKDLCITKKDLSFADLTAGPSVTPIYLGAGEKQECNSTLHGCCWEGTTIACSASSKGGYSGCNRPTCNTSAANTICVWYKSQRYNTPGNNDTGYYRLANLDELSKMTKYIWEWSYNLGADGLSFCTHNDWQYVTGCVSAASKDVPACGTIWNCFGASGNACYMPRVLGSNGSIWSQCVNATSAAGGVTQEVAGTVRCVRPLNRYNYHFSGSGGSSGAIYEKIITDVLPNDKFKITITNGGSGGVYGTSKSNGKSTQAGNGARGGTTTVVHIRNGATLNTYTVLGGFGGLGATTGANGSAYAENDNSTNGTTPLGVCKTNSTSERCSNWSNPGVAGATSKGGNGGKAKGVDFNISNGTASSGGYLYIDNARGAYERATANEIKYAQGQNASAIGYGGGGGLAPAWATGTGHFYKGGDGKNGKVDITYRVNLPGGGGGSGARVGGANIEGKQYEIKYKVTEGDRVVIKIGSGGSGANPHTDGVNGEATVVGDNDIVFYGGQGGKTATDAQKSALQGGSGGQSAYIDENDSLKSVSSGITFKDSSKIGYTISSSSFKGQNGRQGGMQKVYATSGSTITSGNWLYGFSGGVGGSPFNIGSGSLVQAITCGGGMEAKTEHTTDATRYICTSGNINANRAKAHDPVSNEFGGSGGGGGGVVQGSSNLGEGSSGTSGYLRVRWNQMEQD